MSKSQANLPLDKNRELQKGPLNNDIPRIFIAATRQNEGKTTTSLGLFSAMLKCFDKMGYIKPIGQRFVEIEGLKIDEDSYLLDTIYDMNVPIEAMSPVAIDGTFTRRYLKEPNSHDILVDKISRAFDRSCYEKDAVIIEGSGHAGVGAVCDLSNAQVAKILGAKAIIISSGGIGRPLDEIALNKSLFDAHGVEVVGAILNKVLPGKQEMVREYAGKGLERMGVPLLGVIPVKEELTAPNFGQIVAELDGQWINGKKRGANERIEKVIIGAMAARGIIDHFQKGTLVVTPGDRDDVILSAIASAGLLGIGSISGIILTRNLLPHPQLMDMLGKTDIPIAICREDSYKAASKIHSMTVKTQPEDKDKFPIIQDMITENLDLDKLIKAL